MRAVYYNVCQPTRDALVGQLFLRPPVIELPTGLEFLIEDMDGEGSTFEQSARDGANHLVPFGRGGYLTDMPPTDGEITQQDIDNGVRPTIKFFQPWAIRNWELKKINNVVKLSMLVLDEAIERPASGNEFDIETVIYQRVYRLTFLEQSETAEDIYCCSVQIYNEDGTPTEQYDICGQDGTALKEIQFYPAGSEKNSMDVDEPPFTSLC